MSERLPVFSIFLSSEKYLTSFPLLVPSPDESSLPSQTTVHFSENFQLFISDEGVDDIARRLAIFISASLFSDNPLLPRDKVSVFASGIIREEVFI